MSTIDISRFQPATDLFIGSLRETLGEIVEHQHPEHGDLFCLNLTSYLGEKMGPVLRRLADEQAETRKWRDKHTALADEFAAEADRLHAEVDRLREQLFAQKPVIEAAQAWAEALETNERALNVASKLIDIHDAVEQHRVMDLALTTARTEAEVAR